MTTLEQYIDNKVKDFSEQHFQSFYLDVIHRGYILQNYLDEDELFDLHVEDEASYDFLELREILGIDKEDALNMHNEEMADYIRDDYRVAIEKKFIELLKDRLEDIEENLKEDDLTERDIKTYRNRMEKLEKAIKSK